MKKQTPTEIGWTQVLEQLIKCYRSGLDSKEFYTQVSNDFGLSPVTVKNKFPISAIREAIKKRFPIAAKNSAPLNA